MNIPKITVLMSVYNSEKFLKEAMDSILNQSFKDFEFLIINDGSTDKTAKILQSFHDPRINIINNKVNIGLTRSLNKGLRIAKGEYIARMDADDISLSNRLEKQLLAVKKNGNVGLVASWITLIDEYGNDKGHWNADRKNHSPEEIFYTLFFENCLAHSSILFKKDVVMKIGGYNEYFKKAQDYELWTRLAKLTKIVKIEDVLVRFRVYDSDTRSKIVNQQNLNVKKIFLKNVQTLLPKNINSATLLSLKYQNSDTKAKGGHLINVMHTFCKLNSQIIDRAPLFLDKKKLKVWGLRRGYTILTRIIAHELKSIFYKNPRSTQSQE